MLVIFFRDLNKLKIRFRSPDLSRSQTMGNRSRMRYVFWPRTAMLAVRGRTFAGQVASRELSVRWVAATPNHLRTIRAPCGKNTRLGTNRSRKLETSSSVLNRKLSVFTLGKSVFLDSTCLAETRLMLVYDYRYALYAYRLSCLRR